jgi:hypothetical protein
MIVCRRDDVAKISQQENRIYKHLREEKTERGTLREGDYLGECKAERA